MYTWTCHRTCCQRHIVRQGRTGKRTTYNWDWSSGKARIFASSNLNPPSAPHLALLRFVLIFPSVVVGSTLPTTRSTPAWFCTSCCHVDGCFRFFVVFAIGLLRRFLYPILDPLAFAPNTFCTHNLSKYGLFQNPGLHTCFGLNLNRGLNKTNVFASKPSFTQRAVLHKNCVIHKHHVLHKNHVLAGPAQGLFAAYRIALSMVAGGTHRRRLNNMPDDLNDMNDNININKGII